MAAWIRNDTWKCDEELKRDLEGYVKQTLKRDEVLDFVSKKYLMYAWSLRIFVVPEAPDVAVRGEGGGGDSHMEWTGDARRKF